MRYLAPHDPDDPRDESAAERAQLALRAARVRWSVDARDHIDLTSPFSTDTSSEDEAEPLFAT